MEITARSVEYSSGTLWAAVNNNKNRKRGEEKIGVKIIRENNGMWNANKKCCTTTEAWNNASNNKILWREYFVVRLLR